MIALVALVVLSFSSGSFQDFKQQLKPKITRKLADCNTTVSHSSGVTEGVIRSPKHPLSYPGGINCFYEVSLSAHYRLEVQIYQLKIEANDSDQTGHAGLLLGSKFCPFDFLQFDDGYQEITKMCGFATNDSQDEHQRIETSGSYFSLHLHSERLRVKPRGSGFYLLWKAMPSCQDEFHTDMEGIITSVNFPSKYLNNQHCSHHIQVPVGYLVALEFQFFHLEPLDHVTKVCENDFIQVDSYKRCGSWVGKENRLKFYSDPSSNQLSFTFHTNPVITGPGFRATYKAVLPNTTRDCSPQLYQHDQFCFKIFQANLTWNQAAQMCLNEGGMLAFAPDNKTQTALNELLESTPGSEGMSFWLGATDRKYQNDFTWLDEQRVNYTDWFRGWPEFDFYGKQPNDDGLSHQDCLELRKDFPHPSKGHGLADRFYWNDRNCDDLSMFICQMPRPGTDLIRGGVQIFCNGSVELSEKQFEARIISPNFPGLYPDFADCLITVVSPNPNFLMILEFSSFHLEEHPNCSYDFLEMWEEPSLGLNETLRIVERKKLCGDWSDRTKLLRRVIMSNRFFFRFVSDHSRGFPGFFATVRLEKVSDYFEENLCNSRKLKYFVDNCYLIVTVPQLNFQSSIQACQSVKSTLANVTSKKEEMFLLSQLATSRTLTSTDIIWLGGQLNAERSSWMWLDETTVNFTDWYEGDFTSNVKAEPNVPEGEAEQFCLALARQFHTSNGNPNSFWLADRHYWTSQNCGCSGGYVCKSRRPAASVGQNISEIFNQTSGNLTLPTFPDNYPDSFSYAAEIFGPRETRILIKFHLIDMEFQRDCLYDWVEISTTRDSPKVRYCGSVAHLPPIFISASNQAYISFQSDYSINSVGFVASWQTINISDCHVNTRSFPGVVSSVNFPNFYLNGLDCDARLQSPRGTRILLDFTHFDVGFKTELCLNTDSVTVHLEGTFGHRYSRLCGKLNTENTSRALHFLSYTNTMKVSFHSDPINWGVGYQATYETVTANASRDIALLPNETFTLTSFNYPHPYPKAFCFDFLIRTHYGYQIELDFVQLFIQPNSDAMESQFILDESSMNGSYAAQNISYLSPWNRVTVSFCSDKVANFDQQRYHVYKAHVNVVKDYEFWSNKTLGNHTGIMEFCTKDLCYNNGNCLEGPTGPYCECNIAYLGTFCHLSYCDFSPCVHGFCVISSHEHFRCNCDKGYTGKQCDTEIHPCLANPCANKGVCIENLGEFECSCLEGYKGELCEKIDLFQAKTLRESFLRDPFWLGLFMVLGCMAAIGIVNCFRKRCDTQRFPTLCGHNLVQPNEESDEEKELQRQTYSQDEDSDSDIFLNLQDLGIYTTKDGSVQLGDLSFKIRLNELDNQELSTLETYLVNLIDINEPQHHTDGQSQFESFETTSDRNPSGLPSIEESPQFARRRGSTYENDPGGLQLPHTYLGVGGAAEPLQSPSNELSSYCHRRFTKKMSDTSKKYKVLSEAFDDVTDIILKAAEVVTPAHRMVDECGGNSRYSRKLTMDRSRLEEPGTPIPPSKFRSVARSAMNLLRRPSSRFDYQDLQQTVGVAKVGEMADLSRWIDHKSTPSPSTTYV